MVSDTWLLRTKELQHQLGNEVPFTGRDLTQFLKDMVLAAHVELSEALQEVDWKPWKGGTGEVDRAKFVEEMVDVLHFCANILVAVGVTDAEIQEAYPAKTRVVRKRLLDTG